MSGRVHKPEPDDGLSMLDDHREIRRRRSTLQALLVFTLVAVATIFPYALAQGLVVLPIAHTVVFLTCAGLFLANRRAVPYVPLAVVYLVVIITVMLMLITRPDVHPVSYVYLPAIPVFSYILLGHRGGLRMTLGALIVGTGAFVLGAQRVPELLTADVAVDLVTVTLVMFVLCHFWFRSQHRANSAMLKESLSDSLTGLYNRQALERMMLREHDRYRHDGHVLSVILIDLDHFKDINDRFGHDAGDRVLVHVARLLKMQLRRADVAFRMGGEEFAVLLPGTPVDGGMKVAEHIRKGIKARPAWWQGERIHLTMSAGVAELGLDGRTWTDLYRIVDARLYDAKNRGRDRVVGR
ncbi:GGDEF domain-containing protein [Aquisalimonas asiatica]|uniref:diguanylate cyclase n=1 Tax=Aquisalimonas asiatica TaxID=406100 RepID=A0A1H8SMB5_9GAMM|nr:GGDEF domain-containing protein [Aquisalimonas asiatica]SEO79761.1 diguanylate cyclase (GGDEF) domain-containing protein [Aquisalimonas asiatica]